MGSPSLTHLHQLEKTIAGDQKSSFVFDLWCSFAL
jgi:hypothetical protein